MSNIDVGPALRKRKWMISALRRRYVITALVMTAMLLAIILSPANLLHTAIFVLSSLVDIAPFVLPGVVLSAWLNASGATDILSRTFHSDLRYPVLIASIIGAVTPVCGASVLPIMIGLLSAGIPLAPVMAFWLSSPITDPAMLSVTSATLGVEFAIGKTLAAFGLGMLGGLCTMALSRAAFVKMPLRTSVHNGSKDNHACSADGFVPKIWQQPGLMRRFRTESTGLLRLIIICLVPAFAAEHLLHQVLQPGDMVDIIGGNPVLTIPLAVIAGAPMYIDGYAALPLARGLIEHGLSQGAVMAFLVSGGVVSIWGAIVIFPVLRPKPFLLFMCVAITGSMLAGWLFEIWTILMSM